MSSGGKILDVDMVHDDSIEVQISAQSFALFPLRIVRPENVQ